MLYDTNMHLPKRVDKIMDAFEAGKVEELEACKITISKLVDKETTVKLEMIDEEHNKRKKELEDKLKNVDAARQQIVMDLGKNEQDYWETIIGEIIRMIKNSHASVELLDENIEG